jgi:hypothetical protein
MKKCNTFGTWTNVISLGGGKEKCEEAKCTWLPGIYSGGSCVNGEACISGNLDSEANALFGKTLGWHTTSIVVVGLSVGCFCLFLFQVRTWFLAAKKKAEYEEELRRAKEEEEEEGTAQTLQRCFFCISTSPPKMVASGLKWKEAGSEKPSTGTEIKNELLAAALLERVEFKKEEWDKFQVADLFSDSYIKSGDRYFKPAVVEVELGYSAENEVEKGEREEFEVHTDTYIERERVKESECF